MSKDLMIIFAVAAGLMIMQSVGGIMQIRGYKQSIQRMHELGSVGMGQRRGRFFNGNVVVLAADKNHMITGCETLDGKTILARFRPVTELLGKPLIGVSIDTYLQEFRAMPEKEQKRYRGYIAAMEALEMRFERERNSSEEQNDIDQSSNGGE